MDDSTRELLEGARLRIETKRVKNKPQRPTEALEKIADERIEAAQAEGAFDDLTANPTTKQPPLTAAQVRNLAEQRIEAAMRDGYFRDLDGEGKPLDLYDDAHVPADMRLAYRMLKGRGVGAPWQDAQVEYERRSTEYAIWFAHNQADWPSMSPTLRLQRLQELETRLKELNDAIHNLNARAPNDTLRKGLLVYARERSRLEVLGA